MHGEMTVKYGELTHQGVQHDTTCLRCDGEVVRIEQMERLAACWNACRGINPEAVQTIVAKLPAVIDLAEGMIDLIDAMKSKHDMPTTAASRIGRIALDIEEIKAALAALEEA